VATETLWEHGPWFRRLGIFALAVATVGFVVLLATNGWSVNRALNSCVGKDEEELADLWDVAAETLQDVDFDRSDYSGCEDVGKAGEAAAVAGVWHWRHFSAAREFFVAEGWTKQEFPVFHSPDGEHLAHVIMLTEYGDTHVLVYFKHID